MTRLGKVALIGYISVLWVFFNSSTLCLPSKPQAIPAIFRIPVVGLAHPAAVVTFIMGIAAVLGGVGGGVLFVPIISGFFPFNLDFVRGAGLLVALAGALAAGPGLLKMNLASLRLAMPVAIVASTFSIIGAMIGLALPTKVVQIALGATILGICALMLTAKKSEFPEVGQGRLALPGLAHTRSLPRGHHRPDRRLEDSPDMAGTRSLYSDRRHGWYVRSGRGLGERPRAQPAHGRAPENKRGHKQVPPLHNRHLCRLDLRQ